MVETFSQKNDSPVPAPENDGPVNGRTSDEPAVSMTATEDAGEQDDIKRKMETLAGEAAENRDRLFRVSAEFENYKKRMNRQMEDFKKYANESLLKDLLTVVDNLERAVSSQTDGQKGDPKSGQTPSLSECVREGVEMTLAEILKILGRHHVTPIDALNQPFDPALHEAVMRETTDAHPENTAIRVFQKGYRIHDRLLRPAMVAVSAKPASNTNEPHI